LLGIERDKIGHRAGIIGQVQTGPEADLKHAPARGGERLSPLSGDDLIAQAPF
jgi:hypothetical protein